MSAELNSQPFLVNEAGAPVPPVPVDAGQVLSREGNKDKKHEYRPHRSALGKDDPFADVTMADDALERQNFGDALQLYRRAETVTLGLDSKKVEKEFKKSHLDAGPEGLIGKSKIEARLGLAMLDRGLFLNNADIQNMGKQLISSSFAIKQTLITRGLVTQDSRDDAEFKRQLDGVLVKNGRQPIEQLAKTQIEAMKKAQAGDASQKTSDGTAKAQGDSQANIPPAPFLGNAMAMLRMARQMAGQGSFGQAASIFDNAIKAFGSLDARQDRDAKAAWLKQQYDNHIDPITGKPATDRAQLVAACRKAGELMEEMPAIARIAKACALNNAGNAEDALKALSEVAYFRPDFRAVTDALAAKVYKRQPITEQDFHQTINQVNAVVKQEIAGAAQTQPPANEAPKPQVVADGKQVQTPVVPTDNKQAQPAGAKADGKTIQAAPRVSPADSKVGQPTSAAKSDQADSGAKADQPAAKSPMSNLFDVKNPTESDKMAFGAVTDFVKNKAQMTDTIRKGFTDAIAKAEKEGAASDSKSCDIALKIKAQQKDIDQKEALLKTASDRFATMSNERSDLQKQKDALDAEYKKENGIQQAFDWATGQDKKAQMAQIQTKIENHDKDFDLSAEQKKIDAQKAELQKVQNDLKSLRKDYADANAQNAEANKPLARAEYTYGLALSQSGSDDDAKQAVVHIGKAALLDPTLTDRKEFLPAAFDAGVPMSTLSNNLLTMGAGVRKDIGVEAAQPWYKAAKSAIDMGLENCKVAATALQTNTSPITGKTLTDAEAKYWKEVGSETKDLAGMKAGYAAELVHAGQYKDATAALDELTKDIPTTAKIPLVQKIQDYAKQGKDFSEDELAASLTGATAKSAAPAANVPATVVPGEATKDGAAKVQGDAGAFWKIPVTAIAAQAAIAGLERLCVVAAPETEGATLVGVPILEGAKLFLNNPFVKFGLGTTVASIGRVGLNKVTHEGDQTFTPRVVAESGLSMVPFAGMRFGKQIVLGSLGQEGAKQILGKEAATLSESALLRSQMFKSILGSTPVKAMMQTRFVAGAVPMAAASPYFFGDALLKNHYHDKDASGHVPTLDERLKGAALESALFTVAGGGLGLFHKVVPAVAEAATTGAGAGATEATTAKATQAAAEKVTETVTTKATETAATATQAAAPAAAQAAAPAAAQAVAPAAAQAAPASAALQQVVHETAEKALQQGATVEEANKAAVKAYMEAQQAAIQNAEKIATEAAKQHATQKAAQQIAQQAMKQGEAELAARDAAMKATLAGGTEEEVKAATQKAFADVAKRHEAEAIAAKAVADAPAATASAPVAAEAPAVAESAPAVAEAPAAAASAPTAVTAKSLWKNFIEGVTNKDLVYPLAMLNVTNRNPAEQSDGDETQQSYDAKKDGDDTSGKAPAPAANDGSKDKDDLPRAAQGTNAPDATSGANSGTDSTNGAATDSSQGNTQAAATDSTSGAATDSSQGSTQAAATDSTSGASTDSTQGSAQAAATDGTSGTGTDSAQASTPAAESQAAQPADDTAAAGNNVQGN